MKDLLIDTNIITVYLTGARTGDRRYPSVRARFDDPGRRKILISIMSVLEIESGLVMGEKTAPPNETILREINSIRGFIARYKKLSISAGAVPYYARIRAKVFELNGEKKSSGRGYAVKKTHELTERTSDISLGIDERDLLIVSAALGGNLTLATLDSNGEMRKILEAARRLESEGRLPHLDVEFWDMPATA